MRKNKSETYVNKFFSVEERKTKFLNTLALYYANGLGKAEVLFSNNQVCDIKLLNEDGNDLLIFEMSDYDVELKWLDSKVYIEVQLDSIKKLWLRTLNSIFENYKQDYLDHCYNLLNGN